MNRISKFNLVHRFEKGSLLIAINCVAALSIFFFGYDRGVMGGVNTNRDYASLMDFGHWDETTKAVVTDNSLLRGGIVAVYYLPGTLLGALIGGWMGDKYGRIASIGIAAAWAVVGAMLQCSSQNHNWMLCARVFNGIGTGILNAVTPVWATEMAEHTSRGRFVAIEFTLNIFGVVVAYWIEFGTSFYGDPLSSFIWRFPIAFQIAPLLLLFGIVWLMPESPRWLVKVGREEEARYILGRLRGESGADKDKSEAEFQDIRNICDLERKSAKAGAQNYINMFFGIGSGKLDTGRRVQLVIWLQIMQEWIGMAGITVYGLKIFGIVGISPGDQLWVTGLNNTTYMVCGAYYEYDKVIDGLLNFPPSSACSHLTVLAVAGRCVSPFHARYLSMYRSPSSTRRVSETILQVQHAPQPFSIAGKHESADSRSPNTDYGSVGMGFCTFLVGGLSRLGQNEVEGSATKTGAGIGATFFVFLFTAVFGATWLTVPWLTVPWLYPAEIFPLKIRAKGNAWGVVGWSIGNGWLDLICPVMFSALNEKTLYIFGICNIITIPMVYCLYPETNQRTLEEMNLVFASDSIWEAEKNFAILKEQNPSKADMEMGRMGRGMSLDVDPFGDQGAVKAREL